MIEQKFSIALTADFYEQNGDLRYQDIGLSELDNQAQIDHRTFAEHRSVVGVDQIGDVQGVVVLTPQITAESVSQADNLLAIGRFGVGYDTVDVDACTHADVLVYITPGAVDRPVAEATVGWMIALGHHLRVKDRLVRSGCWDMRSRFMGSELRDKTLGIIGMGSIAQELLNLLKSFGMNQPLVYDPFIPPENVSAAGAKQVSLEELCRQADFVSLHCPLTDETENLIGARELSWMKPSAYLLNLARGGIVNEDALYLGLENKQIAGAAIDCFIDEPITEPHRFGKFENVLLAPHSIAWTHELFRDIGRTAFRGMIDLSHGKVPSGVVNPEVLERPGFKTKWERLCPCPVAI